ncbi:MAG: hypothetical protein Q8K65_04290 [Alphaproteobacteria bacterium]|nr:hypothetical protein [Alphaproteobacteria bacterium]
MILLLLIMLASSPASAQTVVLDDAACRAIMRHVPDEDVAYKPGVDVKGKPVVEADLNASPLKVPETISFDITVDALKHAGISAPAGTEAVAGIGRVEVKPDGSMLFNGAPMEGEAEAALRALCKEKTALKQGQNAGNGGLQKRPRGDYNR